MKTEITMIRLEADVKASIKKAAGLESKSVSQYMVDLHIEHMILQNAHVIHCKSCNQYAKREVVKCWNCGNKI